MKGCGPVRPIRLRCFSVSLNNSCFGQSFSDDVLLAVLPNNSLCATWVLKTACKPCATLQTHLVTEYPLADMTRHRRSIPVKASAQPAAGGAELKSFRGIPLA